MNKATITLSILILLSFTASISAYELTVKLSDVNHKKPISIAIYGDEESFLKLDHAKFKKEFPFNEDNTYRFSNIPTGNYAISVFQDLNSNKILDKSLWGIPKEPYGFSNNVTDHLGPPAFKKCTFKISGDITIKIGLK